MNMHSTIAPATLGDNTRSFRDELMEDIKGLGTTEGLGANQRPELAARVVTSAFEGHVASDVKRSDIAEIWSAYYQAMQAAKGDLTGAKQASAEQQISKLRTFAKLGELGTSKGFDPVTYIGKVRELVNTTDGVKGSTFDNMVKVARETWTAQAELTDDEILSHIVPSEKQEISDDERELAELEKAHKSLTKLRDGTTEKAPRPSPELEAVIENLTARMAALTVEIKLKDYQVSVAAASTLVKRAA